MQPLTMLRELAASNTVALTVGTTVVSVDFWFLKQEADVQRLRAGLRKADMPEFRDEWDLDRSNRLSGPEIKDLSFGHTHAGRHPKSGLKFTISRTTDGRFTATGIWNDSGTSYIDGNRLCNRWTIYGESCAVIYKNPTGSKATGDEYFIVQRSGAFPFAVSN